MSKTIKFIPGNRAGIKEDPIKAGIIEVRPGVRGLSLGEKKYAMGYIRVLDEHHYLKGMCVYSDNLPEEYDIVKYCFDPKECLKALKDDRDDQNMPQKLNTDVMTKLRDNGDWEAWANILKDSLQKIGERGKKKEV